MAFSTIPFHRLMREAVVTLLTSYKTASLPGLTIYPGRPQSLYPPQVFRDAQPEDQIPAGINQRQRTIHSQWIAVWGLFDSGEAATQRDDFIDGFTALVLENAHAAGARTELHMGPIEDLPTFQPDWGDDAQRNTVYYATRFTVEGFASG